MSDFFTASDLSWMREEVEKTLPDTCNILSVTRTSNGRGGYTETWGTATANVECRIDAIVRADSDSVVGASERVYNRYVVTLPHDTTISQENRLEVNSYTLAIESIDSPKSEAACLRAYVYELADQP